MKNISIIRWIIVVWHEILQIVEILRIIILR